MPWDDDLEGPTYDIASSDDSPMRVMAGPGTGKTFALQRKVARLLEEGVNPERILVVTFTRAAANDLKKELTNLDSPGVENITVRTLHSYCYSVLHRERVFDQTGRIPRPLLDFEERILLEDLNSPEIFGNYYERKERLQALAAAWAREQHEEPGTLSDTDRLFQDDTIAWLRFHDAILLGEFVPITLRYLRNNPHSPERTQFEYVLVDEYQDWNMAEQSLIDLLSEQSYLTIVGDEDQSIYEDFRYAHPEGIAEFHETHDPTHDVPLEICRRCPTRIIELANELIQYNVGRSGRELIPRDVNPEGEIYLIQWESMYSEIAGVANYFASKIDSKEFGAGEVLILCPSRRIGYGVRDTLRELGIEAHSFYKEELLDGNPKDLDSCQAQESFTLLRLLVDSGDKVALRCWLAFGSPSLRSGEYGRVRDYCSEHGDAPREALDAICAGELKIPYTTHLVNRYRLLNERLEELRNRLGIDIFNRLFPEGEEWAAPFREIAMQIDSDDWPVEDILEAIEDKIIRNEPPTDVDFVRIMSLHKSKGLSAEHVAVLGCVEGLTPRHPNEAWPHNRQARYREEQRRLFYVALTRTKNTLILSSFRNMPRDLTHGMGVRVVGGDWQVAETIASTFFGELGPALPPAIIGEEWDY
jgi:DNA helicase-2/ATP-dependent DNA helicase PcrA